MPYKISTLLKLHREHQRQLDKFGKQDHPPSMWAVILMEEVGEVAREICDTPTDNYEAELIQVAAVALSALENFQEQRNAHASL
jgi:NTP pyrophosphatase (non-canonical NTP hydrolase)